MTDTTPQQDKQRRNIGYNSFEHFAFIRIENMSMCQKLQPYRNIFVLNVQCYWIESPEEWSLWNILNWRCYLVVPAQLIVTFIDNFRLMRPFIVLRTSRSKITRSYTGYHTSRTCSLSPAVTATSPTTWGTEPTRQVGTSWIHIFLLSSSFTFHFRHWLKSNGHNNRLNPENESEM